MSLFFNFDDDIDIKAFGDPGNTKLTGKEIRRNLYRGLPGVVFHPSGSRALGTEEPGSDWDYVVTNTKDVPAFLRKLGFGEMYHERVYKSSYVCAVYEVIAADGEKVQVSVEVDAKYKLAIMETLRRSTALRDLDKSLRSTPDMRDSLWEALYSLAGFKP